MVLIKLLDAGITPGFLWDGFKAWLFRRGSRSDTESWYGTNNLVTLTPEDRTIITAYSERHYWETYGYRTPERPKMPLKGGGKTIYLSNVKERG